MSNQKFDGAAFIGRVIGTLIVTFIYGWLVDTAFRHMNWGVPVATSMIIGYFLAIITITLNEIVLELRALNRKR